MVSCGVMSYFVVLCLIVSDGVVSYGIVLDLFKYQLGWVVSYSVPNPLNDPVEMCKL